MQDFTFKQAIDESYMAVGYRGDETNVNVPSTFYGHDVTVIYDSLFAGHSEIKEVVLPSTIIYLGGHVFDGCMDLTHLDLPEQLMDIMQYAFTRSGIQSLTIPDQVTRIIPYTFCDMPELTSVKLGRHVKRIDGRAFSQCPKLNEVYVPEQAVIHEHAFDNCPQVNIHHY